MLLGVDELRLADARAGTVVNLWAFWPTLLKSDVRLHYAGWADDMVCMRHIQHYPFALLVCFRLFKSHRPVVLHGRRLVRIDIAECEMPRGVEGFGAVYSKLARS